MWTQDSPVKVFDTYQDAKMEWAKWNTAEIVQYLTLMKNQRSRKMNDDDVKQQALEQAQQAYGLFIWFVKWFSYVMIFMITLMFMNNWFDDGTGRVYA